MCDVTACQEEKEREKNLKGKWEKFSNCSFFIEQELQTKYVGSFINVDNANKQTTVICFYLDQKVSFIDMKCSFSCSFLFCLNTVILIQLNLIDIGLICSKMQFVIVILRVSLHSTVLGEEWLTPQSGGRDYLGFGFGRGMTHPTVRWTWLLGFC
jgi:hypothetical protein